MGYTETSDAHCVELTKEQSAITALKAIKAGELDAQTGYERTIQLLKDLGYEKIANVIQKNILEDEIQHEAILTEIIKGLSKIDATNIEKGTCKSNCHLSRHIQRYGNNIMIHKIQSSQLKIRQPDTITSRNT
jgi:hypothetical protein